MKNQARTILLISLPLFLFACNTEQRIKKNYAALVNPFIGTGGHGHTYPGASSPFGFVQLSPDTRIDGWDGCGGYHYSDSVIYGFSHTHLSGTGVSDYGDVLLMPTPKHTFKNGYEIHPDSGYGSIFNHKNEYAEAGYYSVLLESGEIEVELTSTTHAGFHHYQYLESSTDRRLILDLQHRDELIDYQIDILNDSTIRGKRISKAWAQEQHLYYFLKLSKSFESATYNRDSSKVILEFNTIDELYVKVGLSAVDIEGARNNLETEVPDWDFEATKAKTQELWNKELSKIDVQMNHDSDEVIFYTALYHSFLNPNSFEDLDGRYRGTDLQIHEAQPHQQYTIFSLWDTYRATHPLFTITQRKRSLDFIKTFLDQYQNGGKLPVWELAGNYTGCMIGYHSIPVIVDAYMKGIKDFDTELALEAMIATATADELGKRAYITSGYIAKDQEHESVSKTLEYAYDDWCIAQFALALGKDSIYSEFIQRAQSYKNIYDPESTFMRSKRNQQFSSPFNPKEVNFNFTEANSWQYSFYAPQDVSGLISLMGGATAFENKLDSLFSADNETTGRHQADITGLVGQYAHGNEPSHHMAYLYNYVGAESKTQAAVRRLIKEMYSNQPDGLIGNEDCGQMSSWYILSALGFYPVCPGSDEYIIGSPSIQEANIYLENGNTFAIKALNNNPQNTYIQSITLNNTTHSKSYLKQADIMKGGELVFHMSGQPNENYFKEQPKSAITDEVICPLPYIFSPEQVFRDSIEIVLAHADEEASIHYSLNGIDFELYESPFTIYDNAELQIKASKKGTIESKTVGAQFYKIDQDLKVSYSYPYNPQYNAGGDGGLVDLLRGGEDFRTGYWQGFQGEDIEIVVELEEVKEISHINSGYIQDINSWIWMPQAVSYSISTDGKTFKELSTINSPIPSDQYGVFLHEFEHNFTPIQAKYVKLKAKQFGILPDWHLGKGGESFIFIDEVIIR